MQNFPPPCTKSWHLGILRQVYNNLGHFYANKRYIVLFLGVFWCQILRGKNCVGANLYAFLMSACRPRVQGPGSLGQ